MPVLRQHSRGGSGSPACETRIAVGAVPHQGQIIGDRRGRDAELLDDARLVADRPCATIHLHDARAANRLRQILVGRADEHAIHARIRRGRRRGSRQRVVSLELHHRPHRDAQRRQHLLEQRKLREQVGLDAVARLVAGPELIAERLDDVIGRDPDVGGADRHHAEQRCQHAADRSDFPAVAITCRRDGIVMPEELVRAVDEMNVHTSSEFRLAIDSRG